MKNFYLLYSGDGAILNKEINDLEKKLDISDTDIIYYNIDVIDGIINEASTIGMFSLNKFIIIFLFINSSIIFSNTFFFNSFN